MKLITLGHYTALENLSYHCFLNLYHKNIYSMTAHVRSYQIYMRVYKYKREVDMKQINRSDCTSKVSNVCHYYTEPDNSVMSVIGTTRNNLLC